MVTPLRYQDLSDEVRQLYPWPGKDLVLPSGHRLHYLDEGQGQPLLMVHGNPTWSFYWRNLVHGLSDRYRCVVPDHLGCGLSDKPQDWSYRLADHARNVVALIDELDLDNITLVVHDWGGAIGMTAALQRPERIRRVIVFNTAAFYGPLPMSIRLGRLPLVGQLGVLGLNGFARLALRWATTQPAHYRGAVGEGYLAPYRSWEERIATLRFIQDIPIERRHPTRPDMEALEAEFDRFNDRPSLIVWGAKDFCFNDTFLARWVRAYPDAEVHRLAEVGHYVVEDGGKHVVRTVRDWLTRNPLGA